MSLFLIDIGTPVLFVHIPKCGGTSIRTDKDIGDGYRIYDPDASWPKGIPSLAFVRNPLSRVVSCWCDWRYNRCLTDLDFDGFVDAFVGDMDGIDDPSTVQHHLAPMTHPMHGLKHATFVGRFELLQQDFDYFCGLNEIPHYTLSHMRPSFGDPSISTESRVKIESIYSNDHEQYYPC